MLLMVRALMRARSLNMDPPQKQWMGVQILIGCQVHVHIQMKNGIHGGMSIWVAPTLSIQPLLPIEEIAVANVDKG